MSAESKLGYWLFKTAKGLGIAWDSGPSSGRTDSSLYIGKTKGAIEKFLESGRAQNLSGAEIANEWNPSTVADAAVQAKGQHDVFFAGTNSPLDQGNAIPNNDLTDAFLSLSGAGVAATLAKLGLSDFAETGLGTSDIANEDALTDGGETDPSDDGSNDPDNNQSKLLPSTAGALASIWNDLLKDAKYAAIWVGLLILGIGFLFMGLRPDRPLPRMPPVLVAP